MIFPVGIAFRSRTLIPDQGASNILWKRTEAKSRARANETSFLLQSGYSGVDELLPKGDQADEEEAR